MPLFQPSRETIIPGLTVEWLSDHPAIGFTFTETTRPVVDCFVDFIGGMEKLLPLWQRRLLLLDFTHPNCTLNPYLQSRSRELLTLYPHTLASTALVIPAGIQSQVVRLFLQIDTRHLSLQQRRKVFNHRQQGLDWLELERQRG